MKAYTQHEGVEAGPHETLIKLGLQGLGDGLYLHALAGTKNTFGSNECSQARTLRGFEDHPRGSVLSY